MNKKHTNLFKKLLWTMCLAALVILCQVPQARAASPTVEVSTLADLQTAIDAAADGDVILIIGQIDIPEGVSFGGSDKHITIKRANEAAKLNIAGSPSSNPTIFNNFTFDGAEIPSLTAFIESYSRIDFNNVTFKNCISTQSSGAIYAWDGEANFNNCIFENNTGINGGHIAMNSGAIVNINNCILKNGHATGKGGAIFNAASSSTCNITSSIITENKADDVGGGVVNNGAMTISRTKLYNNTATVGGSDIANIQWAWLSLEDSIESLVELFADENLIPTGWETDYIDNTNNAYNTKYLKLAYEVIQPEPTAVILDSASLGTAGDCKIIGLEAGKYYKVTADDVINYVKADGTLTANESEAEPLTGTEIIGLTNGKTYKVEEYTPEPEEPTEPTPDPQPQPEPTPVTPSKPSHSSHSSHTVKPEPVVEKKPAVVLSYGKAVLDTTKTEYLLGYADGLLGNKGTVTRAELAQIVYRLLTPESKAAVYSDKNSFKDVAANAWYNEAVSTMLNAGLISMGADGKYNPDKNITWGEMVSILAKFAEPNHEWKIITRHWAKDALNTAISYRWFEYNDQFNPDGEVTRLEMLNFINTMFKWATK
ncbi:S-layer homology domain-containing protein [Petroclostridium xylanilyticum]|uniref:S-layer homology domain-containing protein n=1 Tax=Petroclostridium xylanilyticum TaxID=1792311 RepID=UPI000B997D70|nr:S-layer homology domain-containing protein [Petroclostridium xylanilyticum]